MAAKQLCPRPRSGIKAWYINEFDREGLSAVRCYESHDDAVRQGTCPVWIQLSADGLRLARWCEGRGCFAEGVLVDGEETLLDVLGQYTGYAGQPGNRYTLFLTKASVALERRVISVPRMIGDLQMAQRAK